MQLSRRLQRIADYVTVGKRTADIGCDHGWVSIYLVKNKISPSVIAMDVREGPLNRAEKHVQEYHLEDKIETRISDGMAALKPGEVESVVIAGLGGPLMIRILEEGDLVAAELEEMILSPQSELEKVRRFLASKGWKTVREEMVFDEGKYYTIMKVVHGKIEEATLADFRYGKYMIENGDPVLQAFLKKELDVKKEILKKICNSDTSSCRDRAEQLNEELEVIKEAMNRLEERQRGKYI